MNKLADLDNKFTLAIKTGEAEEIKAVLDLFDSTCRSLVEKETNVQSKKKLIESCLMIKNRWELEINQLKAKVKDELADIKSNGKKIKKYLTSY